MKPPEQNPYAPLGKVTQVYLEGKEQLPCRMTPVDTSDSSYKDKLNAASHEVFTEVLRAKSMFPENFHNQHEAYAVILEEIDELWDEIKKNQKNYDLAAQRKEAVQAAAMLHRLIVELL